MFIPIQLESDSNESEQKSVVPIVTFPTESENGVGLFNKRDKTFGDILLPALSKYLQLRDSKRKDLQSLLLKEHPFHIEDFKNAGDKYELQLNVQKFKPEELHVKITDDSISILGEHEEKAGQNNYTRQQFLRRYSLPDKVNADAISCELSSDGYLVISAPKMSQKVKITEIPCLPIDSRCKEDEHTKTL